MSVSQASNQPSQHALDILPTLTSIPEEARFAELSIQTSRRIANQGLVKTLCRYKSQCLENNKDQIDDVIDSVEFMGQGGDTKLFTLAFTNKKSKVQFLGIAARHITEKLIDYCICSYTYEEPKEVWKFLGIFPTESKVAIKNETLPYLEAAFLFELCRRGFARMNGNQLELTI